jgi:hypothetical protein
MQQHGSANEIDAGRVRAASGCCVLPSALQPEFGNRTGGASGFLGCGARLSDAEGNRAGWSSADGPSEIKRMLSRFGQASRIQDEGVATSGYGLLTPAEQLPPFSD